MCVVMGQRVAVAPAPHVRLIPRTAKCSKGLWYVGGAAEAALAVCRPERVMLSPACTANFLSCAPCTSNLSNQQTNLH